MAGALLTGFAAAPRLQWLLVRSPQTPHVQKLRRNLLKSAAGLPLVLTVRPASAQAKTSLAACLHRDEKHRVREVFTRDPQADEWLRAKLDMVELSYWDEDKRKWVDIEDRRFYLGFDKSTYWQLDRHDPYRAPASPSKYRKGHGVREKKKGELHPVVSVREDGQVVGVAWEKHGGRHISKSCWASLIPKHRG